MSEAWQTGIATIMTLIGIAAFGGLLGWMFNVSKNLGEIATSLKGLAHLADKVEIHDKRLNDHGERIFGLEKIVKVQQ